MVALGLHSGAASRSRAISVATYSRDRRRDVNVSTGTIKKLISDRGFGFIQQEDGTELFFHRSAVAGTTFDQLTEGQSVTYEKTMDPRRNKENAANVTPA